MKEIGPIAETGHTAEIGHIVEIDHEATTEMTIKMITTKLTIEMSIGMTVGRKIIGISKTRDMREGLNTIIKTGTARIIIEIVTKIKISTKADTDIEMTAMILGRSRSREKPCTYDERKVSNRSKLELIHNIISQLYLNNDITSRFIEAVYANADDVFYNACSVAEVDHWIAGKLMYARCKKAKSLMKETHVNVSIASSQNYVNPVDYESIHVDTSLTQESVDMEFIEEKVDNYYTSTPVTFEEEDTDFHRIDVCDMVELQDLPCKIVEVDMQDFPTTIMDELVLWESIEIPGTPIRLVEGQILEEFMLEEEIEFQGIGKCKIVELPDKQDIERC